MFTEHIYRILPVALGITMIIQGIFETWIGWKTEEYKEKETKLTSNGIVFLVLGSVILCNYSNADFIIGAIWGVLSLVKGSEELNQVLYRRIHKAPYRSKLIHCCIELLLGLILLVDPSASIKHHSRFTIQVQHMAIGKKGVTHRRRCPKMVFVDSQERGSIL